MAFEHLRTLYVLVFVCPRCKGPAFSWRREKENASLARIKAHAHPVHCGSDCGIGIEIMDESQVLAVLSTPWPEQESE